MGKTTYSVTCKRGHRSELELTDFDDALEDGCPRCGGTLEGVEPSRVEIACIDCPWSTIETWDLAREWKNTGCPDCEVQETTGRVHVRGSMVQQLGEYDSFHLQEDKRLATRPARPDYWEYLIHFAQRDELTSILESSVLRAAATGYYRTPAVCFTEAPLKHCEEIRACHGDYGLVFRKRDLVVNYGADPAIQLTDDLIRAQEAVGGFSNKLKPFVNVLRLPETAPVAKRLRFLDFLHEREWRVPGDVLLEEAKPAGLVLPNRSVWDNFVGEKWNYLLKASFAYGVVKD